ncbi:MAG: hypothetical protein CSB24_06290 [Deltaproteobacteria bacterium]|nr:MAG: hypothetical protein CSB24_06290 [Deltaproteobacteria bacterium]
MKSLAAKLAFIQAALLAALLPLAVQASDSGSLMSQAKKYYWGQGAKQDYQKALQLYEQAAENGNPLAQFIAGGMYYTGKGTEVNLQKAFDLLSRAAAQGKTSPEAQMALGTIYLRGQAVPQNYVKAKESLHQAALAGNAEAQNELGFMYFVGNGVEKDYDQAMKWFDQAAGQGLSIAQFNVGMMWYLGSSSRGTDLVKAYAWLALAESGGHPGAAGLLQHIKPMLPPEELRAAQQLSSEMYEQYHRL